MKPAVGTEAVTQGRCMPEEPGTWRPLPASQDRQTQGQGGAEPGVAGRQFRGCAVVRAGWGPPSSGDRPWPSARSAP